MLGTGDAIWFSDGEGNSGSPPHNPVNPSDSRHAVPGHPVALTKSKTRIRSRHQQLLHPGRLRRRLGQLRQRRLPQRQLRRRLLRQLLPTRPSPASAPSSTISSAACRSTRTANRATTTCSTTTIRDISATATTPTPTQIAKNTSSPSRPRPCGTSASALDEKHISWAYYGDQCNRYLHDPYETNPADEYCNICNLSQYSTSIMTNRAARTAAPEGHDRPLRGHRKRQRCRRCPSSSRAASSTATRRPRSSICSRASSRRSSTASRQSGRSWPNTAIFITFDEGGGYFDSGYVQPLDFFGDGTRIPMIVRLAYSHGGAHQAHLHRPRLDPEVHRAQLGLSPITNRSRDNLPNPSTAANPYVPANGPAIGDLMDMFDFGQQ